MKSVTYLAPAPGGFRGHRGWYITTVRDYIVAGPFKTAREAEAALGRKKA